MAVLIILSVGLNNRKVVHRRDHESSYVRRMTVTGGFLDGFDVRFEDGLVCFIGPRGSGKTTVQELLRFALDMPPEDGCDNRQKSRKRFESLIDVNLGNGTVEVEFETKDKTIYKIQRSNGDLPIVIDDNGEPVNTTILKNRIQIDAPSSAK